MTIIKDIQKQLLNNAELQVTLNKMESALTNDILSKIVELSQTTSNVIITGEPGTGKNWIARLLHVMEDDPDTKFFYLPCDQYKSVGVDNFSSHLKDDLNNIYQEKNRCNVLIDNYSELISDEQVSLLRTILEVKNSYESKYIFGDNKVRFILTMGGQRFRSNTKEYIWNYLFDLLNPVSVVIPPLREHREDITPLANLFLKQQIEREYNQTGTLRELKISNGALYKCISYDWPGNIRQLKNAITHAYLCSESDAIQKDDLPYSIETSPSFPSGGYVKYKSWSYIKAEQILLENYKPQDDRVPDVSFKSMLKRMISINQ